MTEESISAVRQDEVDMKKESLRMRTRTWIKDRNLYLVCAAYYALCITLYMLTLKGNPLHGKELKPGIILGLFFPSLSILYFYRHYWRKGAPQLQSIITWILPALLVHVIIIFGFIITLRAPDKLGYTSSMYSSFYTYGNVFKSYHKLEKDFLEKIDDYAKKPHFSKDELATLYSYYASYFDMASGLPEEPDILTREEYFRNFMTMAPQINYYASYFDMAGDLLEEPDRLTRADYLEKFMKMAPRINRIPFHIAFAFGFLGALIFSLSDAVRRFNELDLYPKTYLFYSIRFIVAASLAVTLAYVVIKDWPILMGPLVFFLIGYFPERAIKYLDDKMTKFLGIKEKKYEPIPLSNVQGLSEEKALRLREVGIQDVQNLALADINYLIRNTPFSAAMLADWIAQSLIILYFPENIQALRHQGVRTILDFRACMLGDSQKNLEDCAALIGVKTEHLLHIAGILKLDHMEERLAQLHTALGKYSVTESMVPEVEPATA